MNKFNRRKALITLLLHSALGKSCPAFVITAVFSVTLPLIATPAVGAPLCLGEPATKVGNNNGQTINGTARKDVIVGLGGNDVINGLGGNDVICGDFGDGRASGGADTLNGGPGEETLQGEFGSDVLNGQDGDDPNLEGGDGNDTLRGGAGDDFLNGTGGNDKSFGEAGNDTIADSGPGTVNSMMSGGDGNDIIEGGGTYKGDRGQDQLLGSDGNDILDGGPGNDPVIDGGLGKDSLTGGSGNDGQVGSFDQFGNPIFPNFTGGDGDDTINEGNSTSGADDMSGGVGADTVDYSARTIGVIVNLRQDLDFLIGTEGEDANLDNTSEEGDTIRSDIENARGGTGPDFLAGTEGVANVITGNKSPDGIEGYGGGDTLRGGEDADFIFSDDGASNDSVTCGPASDNADVDTLDTVAADCENVF
ncbi:MAG: calcium-binding protein [Gammaproteobacteria bacterium]